MSAQDFKWCGCGSCGRGGVIMEEKRGLEAGRGRLGRLYCRGEVVVDYLG